MQPSSLGNAVVEHKAQRHFEGFLLPSVFIAMVYSAAHEVLKRTIVPHIVFAMYIAVLCRYAKAETPRIRSLLGPVKPDPIRAPCCFAGADSR